MTAARTFGATHTINASQQDAVEAVKELTGGRGADYLFVTVGNAAAATQGAKMIRRQGTMVIVGIPETGPRSPCS